ncbi:tRNA pseudouridine(55) synthase TruB [Candidatus Saccharibacteria bacterium]|nr:tRNA pseudouridine(55) synthase TruB [Candidatus Saccharibacteria bacterium]
MFDSENQIILVDKPAGLSSFGVVAKIRGYLKNEFDHKVKVGHTGTLDPFATGLLIILTGKMTKKSNEFLKKDKVYEATMKLGYTSTTGDPEGKISGNGPGGRGPEESVVAAILQEFVGNISQTPPRFSAIKINGERAYKLARKGADFELPSREITIYSIKIISYNYPELTIRCHVSSGTYIRTLAEDIGQKLGTGAYLTALRRLSIADYSVEDAHPLSDFTSSK